MIQVHDTIWMLVLNLNKSNYDNWNTNMSSFEDCDNIIFILLVCHNSALYLRMIWCHSLCLSVFGNLKCEKILAIDNIYWLNLLAVSVFKVKVMSESCQYYLESFFLKMVFSERIFFFDIYFTNMGNFFTLMILVSSLGSFVNRYNKAAKLLYNWDVVLAFSTYCSTYTVVSRWVIFLWLFKQ